jgi:hypothetical protein
LRKLQPYFAFLILIVFIVSCLPFQIWQQNQYLQHVQALQNHDNKHHCEFDQLHCQAQLLKHSCQHSAHLSVKFNAKQLVFFQTSAATISKIGLQSPLFFQHSDLFNEHVSDAKTLVLASVLLRGPPVSIA